MSGIKATNSKNLTVKDCKFDGFETDIELENVEGFLSENNQFSKDTNSKILLKQLSSEILKSNIDECSKKRLAKEIVESLLSKEVMKEKEGKIKKTLKYIGDKAVDLFIQIVATSINKN